MSGILHKLDHYLKELNKFAFPAKIHNYNDYISDQLSCIALKKHLEHTIENKEDDFVITYVELLALVSHTEKIVFNNVTLSQLANEVVKECNIVINEREALLKAILELIYHCKIARDISFINEDKVNSKISIIFKKLFKQNDHFKAADIISFIHTAQIKSLYVALYKFTFFSSDLIRQYTDNQLQDLEQVEAVLVAAKKIVLPQRVAGISFTPKLQSITQVVTTSAPNTPVTNNIDTSLARSRSLPDAVKAQSAATRITESVTLMYPHISRKQRSSSDSPLKFPEGFEDRRPSCDSTAVTLIPDNEEKLPELLYNLKLAPSSKSEDDSEDLNKPVKKYKKEFEEEKAQKRGYSKKK
jgi:hypothetical protein